MHGRLKHLIISSETFKEKKKAKYNVQAKANKTIKEKEWENIPRESGFWGLVEKERGKEKGSMGKVIRLR